MNTITDRRIPIRLLVRVGDSLSSVHRLGGYAMAVVGPARAEDWGAAWQSGDREAVVWVKADGIDRALVELRQMQEIADTREPVAGQVGAGNLW